MKRVTPPLAISILLILGYVLLRTFHPGLLGENGAKYFLAALVICVGVTVARIISFFLFDIIFQKRKGREASEILRILLSIIIYSAIFVFIVSVIFEQDLTGFLVTSTVLSVILGLALQDTLGNFFAGISLHIEQPFFMGDAIKIDEKIGRVEAITWRTTTLRTNDNTLVVFPNSKVARESLEVFPLNNLNRRVLRFPAPYGVPPQKVIPMVREAVRSMTKVATEITPVVRVHDFSESSINYEILYWVKDYMWTPDIDAKIRERIWYVYRRSEIDIPFPTRHVLLEQLEAPAKAQDVDYEAVIGLVDIFEPLTEEERDEVVRGLVRHLYAPGEVILRSGDAGESMFVIYRGKVEVRLPAANGQPQKIASLEAGNFFGEMALFTGEPRNADVSAIDEVEIFEITKSSIEQLLSQNAKLAELFSRKIAERQQELAQYSRTAGQYDNNAARESILQRIKRFFSLS